MLSKFVGEKKTIEVRRVKKNWIFCQHGERIAQVLHGCIDRQNCDSVPIELSELV